MHVPDLPRQCMGTWYLTTCRQPPQLVAGADFVHMRATLETIAMRDPAVSLQTYHSTAYHLGSQIS